MRKTLMALMTLPLAACSGDDFSQEDALTAYNTVSTVVGQAVGEAVGSSLRATQTSSVTDFSYTCMGGGDITMSGAVTNITNFDLALTFNACSSSGITIGGDLNYAFNVGGIDLNDPQNSTPTFAFSMDGTLSYTGSVEGDCVYDISSDASGGGATPTLEGSICGVDVNDAGVSPFGG